MLMQVYYEFIINLYIVNTTGELGKIVQVLVDVENLCYSYSTLCNHSFINFCLDCTLRTFMQIYISRA